jgi:hypothetical protein
VREISANARDRRDARQALAAKPERRDAFQSAARASLLVAWRANAKRQVRRRDPRAVVGDLDRLEPAARDRDRNPRAPASRAFSTSSLTTESGRSTTSPAAICPTVVSSRSRITRGS